MAQKKKPARLPKPATAADAVLKLNLGAGDQPLEGYVNLDRKDGHEVYPLSCADESVDEIRASHVLEHFSHRETLDVLKNWVAKLKPGGVLKIAVPDLDRICMAHAKGTPINTESYLIGGHLDNDDKHGAVFNYSKMCELFKELGLERTRTWKSEINDCASTSLSLNLMAYKPSAPRIPFDGVVACLASARYGPALHHKCIYQAFMELGIRMHMTTGCFWHQQLQTSMEQECGDPRNRYILTLDFDTVFQSKDVIELYRIMETHPHIDALVSTQSKRGSNEALFTMAGDDGTLLGEVPAELFDRLTAKINTGHFGLSMFRIDKLRDLPKPWMCPVPDPNGSWGEGHIDADITFWKQWRDVGYTVHLANRVCVGHVEETIMWPGQDLAPIYQRAGDYMNYGKPAEAR